MTVLGLAVAVSVPFVNTVPPTDNVEFAAFVHEAPATSDRLPAIDIEPLFVIATAAEILTVPANVRFEPADIVFAAERVSIDASDDEPVPLIVVPVPESVIVFVPAHIPLSVKLPAAVTAAFIVVMTPLLITMLPNVIVLAIIPLPVNVVVEFVRLIVPRVLVTLFPK